MIVLKCELKRKKKIYINLHLILFCAYLVPMGLSLREIESPKSEMMACFDKAPVSKTFSGLMSLCRIWCPWRWLIPRAIPVAMCLADSTSSLFVALNATSRLYRLQYMRQQTEMLALGMDRALGVHGCTTWWTLIFRTMLASSSDTHSWSLSLKADPNAMMLGCLSFFNIDSIATSRSYYVNQRIIGKLIFSSHPSFQ